MKLVVNDMAFWPPSALVQSLEYEDYHKLVDPNYKKLPEVTLSAFAETGVKESSIPVLEQRSYTGRKPVISSSLADTPCIDIGVVGLWDQLNTVLGTSYPLDPIILHPLLDSYVAQRYDFGTVFGYLRPYWYDITTMNEKLHAREKKDKERREDGFNSYGRPPDTNIIEAKKPPRRLWDLYANRVLPYWVTYEGWVAISHAWMNEVDRQNIKTPINGCEWPVPMPNSVDLNHIRIEMLNIGAEYVWLDVLCLRQAGGRGEHLRAEEWKVDVPTIGAVYAFTSVVCYFNGLGRPLNFQPGYFESDRCWFNRAWTLQETTESIIIGGETDDVTVEAAVQRRFDELLEMLQQMRRDKSLVGVLSEMRKRVSTNPMDRIAGLAYLLDSGSLPVYDMMQSKEEAWEALTDVMSYNYRARLFFSYPMPGNGKKYWRPSWEDVMTETPPLLTQKHYFGEVRRPQAGETDCDRYDGKFIHSSHLRGLASTSQEGVPRQGELKVFGKFGKHSITGDFKVIANHQYPIPDGLYTLIGNRAASPPENVMLHWVAGKMQDGKFRKCSVFSMADDGERRELLEFYRAWVTPGMRPDVMPASEVEVMNVTTPLC